MTRYHGAAGVWLCLLVVLGAVAGALAEGTGLALGDGPARGLTDLAVYRYGGRAVLEGTTLSGAREATGLPFTYPPFAAVLMTPLAIMPAWLAAGALTGASMAALAACITVVRRSLAQPLPGRSVALLAAGTLTLEPVWQNLTFGQVNLLLMSAALVDLLGPQRRWSGVLVGVAAGVKLTPLLLVVLLLLVGRRTAAGRALLAFVATIAIGFLVRPGSSTAYWTEDLLHAGRVGPPELAHNQSVFGALTRLLDGPAPLWLWLAVAGGAAWVVLALGAMLWHRGDRALGTCLAALAMLIGSPVSWSHHWVWAVPVALCVWHRSRWLACSWVAVFVARPIEWPPWGDGDELAWTPLDHLVGNAYLLAALVVAAWSSVCLLRSRPQSRRLPLDLRQRPPDDHAEQA